MNSVQSAKATMKPRPQRRAQHFTGKQRWKGVVGRSYEVEEIGVLKGTLERAELEAKVVGWGRRDQPPMG